ncbi:hypothetical protein AGMMS49545_16200 [Betaproteobacteria bacterium]|nr:hypothetical protein AGMMS49545_16200 [Betaproteobacteria bacterium]GHU42076.1 hypothetical protein AGMMS50289_06200 [Betaproteobacteria bacterium]
MKVLDRLTGERLNELPSPLLPDRYRLLEPFTVNGHSKLQVGDLLSDDGSGAILIQGAEHPVVSNNPSDEELADSELSAEAIITIVENKYDSPMLPAEMAAQCKLKELERKLATVLEAGHLHSISDRPRIDLRYEDIVAPVARVRRLATSALSHLASHSDCWQQRTLSGIQPRKILARFSEDDHAIYENRLYKRLLDRLDRHLAKRLARIRSVNSRLEKALEFQNPDQTHFRLRERICKLWGDAYQFDKTNMHLEAGKSAVTELESQLRSIRELKQRGLYTLLPVASTVPTQVHRTNILNHDPHYRHLPPLWDELKNDPDQRKLTPEERLEHHQRLQHAYISYVGLVLRQALERYGLQISEQSFQWGGKHFVLKNETHDWIVEESDGTRLRLIPITWFGVSIENEENISPNCVVCWPGTTDSVVSPRHLPVSPLDLYVVEKMGHLIDEWMLKQLLNGYGRKLGPLPNSVKQLAEKLPENFEPVSTTHVKLVAPLDDQPAADVKNSLLKDANEKVNADVLSAIEQIETLSRLCGHKTTFGHGAKQDGFHCECENCGMTWSLNKRLFFMRQKEVPNRSSEDDFLWFGRDWLKFDLDL